jgi:hypothetical protein
VSVLATVSREFDLTPAKDATVWGIAADRAEELGEERLANLMRQNPAAIHDKAVKNGHGYGSGYGYGYGDGSGDGDGYGSGYGYG